MKKLSDEMLSKLLSAYVSDELYIEDWDRMLISELWFIISQLPSATQLLRALERIGAA